MIVLALDTTGDTCGVALASCTSAGMNLIELREVFGSNVHDARIAELTQGVLSGGNVLIEDVDLVAVSAGPGSFTGTRIGVSFAKGLTLSGRPQLMLVDTARALAGAAHEIAIAAGRRGVMVVIPSHQDMVYTDSYVLADTGDLVRSPFDSPRLQRISEIEEHCCDERVLVCGPGAGACTPSPISGLTRLSARFIAREACRHPVFDNPLTAEPLYRQEFKGRY